MASRPLFKRWTNVSSLFSVLFTLAFYTDLYIYLKESILFTLYLLWSVQSGMEPFVSESWESCQKHIRPLWAVGKYLFTSFWYWYFQREQWVRGANWNFHWGAGWRRNQLPEKVLDRFTVDLPCPLSSSSSSLCSSSCSTHAIAHPESFHSSTVMISTGSREVEETGLLSESDRMLSKTVLVPLANHAQVITMISHNNICDDRRDQWSQDQLSCWIINPQVSSGSIPEDVIDNDIDPELTEAEAHQVNTDLMSNSI